VGDIIFETLQGKRSMWLPSVTAVLLSDQAIVDKVLPSVQRKNLDPVTHVLRVVDSWTKGLQRTDPGLLRNVNRAHSSAGVTPDEIGRVWTTLTVLPVLFGRGLTDGLIKRDYLSAARHFGNGLGVPQPLLEAVLVDLKNAMCKHLESIKTLPDSSKDVWWMMMSDPRFKLQMATDGWALRSLKVHLPARFAGLYAR